MRPNSHCSLALYLIIYLPSYYWPQRTIRYNMAAKTVSQNLNFVAASIPQI